MDEIINFQCTACDKREHCLIPSQSVNGQSAYWLQDPSLDRMMCTTRWETKKPVNKTAR